MANEKRISCRGAQENLHRNDTYFENTKYSKGDIIWDILPERKRWTGAAPELNVNSKMAITFTTFDLECDHDTFSIEYVDGTPIWQGGCKRRTPFTISLPKLMSTGLIPFKYVTVSLCPLKDPCRKTRNKKSIVANLTRSCATSRLDDTVFAESMFKMQGQQRSCFTSL